MVHTHTHLPQVVTSYSKAQHPNHGHVPDAPDELEMRSFNGTGTGNPNHRYYYCHYCLP